MGRVNGFPIASILGNDIQEAVKSLMNSLQITGETFIKYTSILDQTSNDNELVKICEEFEKEYLKCMKSLNESTTQLVGEIFEVRISLLDSYFSGSYPFK